MLLMGFSGGYDSTACLIKLLEEGQKVHAHHLYIDNIENPYRWKCEEKAVKNIIPLLSDKYGNLLTYTESNYSYHHLDSLNTAWWGLETINAVYAMCLIYENYCRLYEASDKTEPMEEINIALTVYKIEFPFWFNEKFRRAETLVEAYTKLIPFNTHIPRITYPILDMDKKQVIDSIPIDILKHCWTCRYPTEDLKRCNSCPSCRRVIGLLPEGF
jgi:hypothetical protein